MIDAILFYSVWLLCIGLLSLALRGLYKIWWSIFALSKLEEHEYSAVVCTTFEELAAIKPICERHDISYRLIYFGRLCGRALNRLKK